MIYWYEHPEAVARLKQDFHELHLLLRKDTDTLVANAVLEEAGFFNSQFDLRFDKRKER